VLIARYLTANDTDAEDLVQEPYSCALATIPTGGDRVYQCHVLCWGKSNYSATRRAPAYVLINRRDLGQLASRGRLIARPAAAEADYRGIRPPKRCPRLGRIPGGVGCSRFTTTGNVLKHRQGHQHAGLRRPGAATRFRLLRARQRGWHMLVIHGWPMGTMRVRPACQMRST